MAGYPQAHFLTSAHQPGQFLPDSGAEVAFAGRSNAGKSSAINAIVHRRQLAHASRQPGRTQLVNFFHLEEGRRIVDLPGYGFARVSEAVRTHWRELLESYFQNRRCLQGLFLAVDSRRGLGPMDLQMLEWCFSLGHPVHVLLTKADKLRRREAAAVLKETAAALQQKASVQLFSTLDGQGVEAARIRLKELLQR